MTNNTSHTDNTEACDRLARAHSNITCYFTMANRRCQVTQVGTFSGVLHYGFITVDDSSFTCGWVPVEFVGGCEISK